MWAVIPIKPQGQSKSRLTSVFSGAALTRLFEAMLEDVLTTLRQSAAIEQILLVTSQQRGGRLARAFATELLEDTGAQGLNGAVQAAANHLCRQQVNDMLVLHGDIPLISTATINQICAQHQPSPSLTLAPDLANEGTNGMLASPPDLIPFSYGIGSLQKHIQAAVAKNVQPGIVNLPDIALDIDQPADLEQLAAHSGAAKTKHVLAEISTQSSIELKY